MSCPVPILPEVDEKVRERERWEGQSPHLSWSAHGKRVFAQAKSRVKQNPLSLRLDLLILVLQRGCASPVYIGTFRPIRTKHPIAPKICGGAI